MPDSQPSASVRITVEGVDELDVYASIPISYQIFEVLDLDSPSDSDSLLPYQSTQVDEPITKDYDALKGNHPHDWPARFDIRGWGFLAAYINDLRVGGAIVLKGCPDIEMLEGRNDLALLWDIRVAPAARNHGVGTLLLSAAESWAKTRDARVLKVETQNTNVPACRFYAHHGFALRAVNRDAYPDLPGEAQLLWYKDLG